LVDLNCSGDLLDFHRRVVDLFHFPDETVSAFRHSLEVKRIPGTVTQCAPQFRDALGNRVVGDSRILPELIKQFFPGYQALPMGQKVEQNLERFGLEVDLLPLATEAAPIAINFYVGNTID